MQIFYKVPKNYEDNLNKQLQEIKTYKLKYEKLNWFQKLFSYFEPPCSEITIRQNLEILNTLDLLFNHDTKNAVLIASTTSLKYDLYFDSVQLKTEIKHNKVSFHALHLNRDYDDITIFVNVDKDTQELELILIFPSQYMTQYQHRESIKVETPIKLIS